jgi:membrane-bound ClpP family serine protease
MNESSHALLLTLPAAGLVVLTASPSGWVGVLLILIALMLVAGDLHLGFSGLLAVVGVAAFVIGVLVLVGAAGAQLGVPLWLLFGGLGLVTLVAALRVRRLWQDRRTPVPLAHESMVGRTARALTPLEPSGYVQIGGESWKARLMAGRASAGETVSVVSVHGLELEVRRIGKGISGQQGAGFPGQQGR